MKIENSKKIKTIDFLSCERCKIHTDTKDRMIPCPRGGCEAKIIGKKIITTEIKLK